MVFTGTKGIVNRFYRKYNNNGKTVERNKNRWRWIKKERELKERNHEMLLISRKHLLNIKEGATEYTGSIQEITPKHKWEKDGKILKTRDRCTNISSHPNIQAFKEKKVLSSPHMVMTFILQDLVQLWLAE